MRNPTGRGPFVRGLLFVVACGAIAGWFVNRVVPAEISKGELAVRDQRYTGNWQGEPFVVDDVRRLPIPFSFADFDMEMEVEVGEGVTLDIISRLVEPRVIGSQLTPFHGRFTVLRLTADRAGPPWLSREDALLGDRTAAGVELAPGHTATVWLSGRGRELEANVAGKRLGTFEAADRHGSFLIVARGGTAVVRSLSITPIGQLADSMWSWWFWTAAGGLLGAAVGAVAIMLGALPYLVGLWLVLAAFFVSGERAPPLLHPQLPTLLALLGASGCIGLCLAPKRLWLAAVGIALLYVAPPVSRSTAALDAVFGPTAGSQLSEAHAQLVRGPLMIHDARPTKYRVFLLGGHLLYGRPHEGVPPEQHLEVLLAGDLAAALEIARPERVDVPSLPTIDGDTGQQWEVFSRFYRSYRPRVIVFGVPIWESAVDPDTGKPRSRPELLRGTLAAVQEYCRSNEIGLVLFADHGLPRMFFTELGDAAGDEVPLVIAEPNESPASMSKRLAAAIAPMLR